MEYLLIVGGIYNFGFGVFHLLFWKIFRWNTTLGKLDHVNRSIMQVLNLCLTFCLLFFAYVSLFHSPELLTTRLGNIILAAISLFWLLRAICQVVIFKLRATVSVVLLLIFAGGFISYSIPLIP